MRALVQDRLERVHLLISDRVGGNGDPRPRDRRRVCAEPRGVRRRVDVDRHGRPRPPEIALELGKNASTVTIDEPARRGDPGLVVRVVDRPPDGPVDRSHFPERRVERRIQVGRLERFLRRRGETIIDARHDAVGSLHPIRQDVRRVVGQRVVPRASLGRIQRAEPHRVCLNVAARALPVVVDPFAPLGFLDRGNCGG